MASYGKREPCVRCGQYDIHADNCPLFPVNLTKDIFQIFHQYPCNPLTYLHVYIKRYCAMSFGDHFQGREHDLLQEIVLKLIENSDSTKQFPSLPELIKYFVVTVRYHIIDEFRKDRGQHQCGYCFHYVGRTCSLQMAKDGMQHPHRDRAIDYTQSPRKLEPPCQEFSSRKHVREVSLESGQITLQSPLINPEDFVEKTQRQQLIYKVLNVLAEHSIRMSFIIRRLFFEEASLPDVAAELGVSRKTVKRDRKKAIELLKTTLSAEEFSL